MVFTGARGSLTSFFFLLVRPSKPKCELEGELTEGSDLTLQCESSSGTEPIVYSWQRVQEKRGEDERLPPKSKIGESSFHWSTETTGQLVLSQNHSESGLVSTSQGSWIYCWTSLFLFFTPNWEQKNICLFFPQMAKIKVVRRLGINVLYKSILVIVFSIP